MFLSEAILRTAQDALQAKTSCIMSPYEHTLPQGPHPNVYKELMLQMNGASLKRQSPLVHAGYAVRMAALSSVLSQFLQTTFSEKDSDAVLNVLILGAGLDPLGLWALNLVPHAKVQVYELDGPENVDLKADKLFTFKDISLTFHKDRHAYSAKYIPHKPNTAPTAEKDTDCHCNYHLMAADLRNVTDVASAIGSSGFQFHHPTIILSELVLAYLGKDHVQNLMRYINDSFCRRNPSTLFVSYEPVHPTGSSSVVTGYAKDYFDQFTSKLNRGKHMNQDHDSTTGSESKPLSKSSSPLEPIGTSSEDVRRMLRRQGFDGYVDCSPVARISSYLNVCSMDCTQLEPFDEHAALLLHLQCYSLICATSSHMKAKDLIRICPWVDVFHSGKGRGFYTSYFLHILDDDNENMNQTKSSPNRISQSTPIHPRSPRYILSAIQSKHQKQFQSLFQKTYEPLFNEFPSVKKLVQSALKNDLSIRTRANENRNENGLLDHTNAEYSHTDCCIWNHYASHDGAFFVVLDPKKEDDKDHEDHIDCDFHRASLDMTKVIGGIGLKKCTNQQAPMHVKDQDGNPCLCTSHYEIFRLTVDSKYQGQGIGKELIHAAESYIHSREWKVVVDKKDKDHNATLPILLVVTTPEILSAANHFYTSMGFDLHSETMMGTMKIRTFTKCLHC